MNEQMKYQQDLRLHGKETADDLARLRRLVAENRRLIEKNFCRADSQGMAATSAEGTAFERRKLVSP